jgi:hypothetical protein
MSAKVEAQEQITKALLSLATAVSSILTKPIFFVVERDEGGEMVIRQIEFLTTDEFAALCKKDRKTVYAWIRQGIGPRWFQPVPFGDKLCLLSEALDWIMSDKKETASLSVVG